MPLSMLSEFTAMDVKSGAPLDNKWSVYKLVGRNDEEIVVKVETKHVDVADFKAAKRTMKIVDRGGADAKLLTTAEKEAMRAFVKQTQRMAGTMSGYRMPVFANTRGVPQWVTELGNRIDAGLWYKMPMRKIADLKQALGQRMQNVPDRGLLTTFLDTLRGPSGLESLGMVIACDLINGNGDRFHPQRGQPLVLNGVTFTFRTIWNISNVFIVGTGTSRSVTGMDFLDPNSQHRYYSMTIQQATKNSGDAWLGTYLLDTSKRRQFCKDIVWDLNLVFSGGNPNAPNRLSCAAGSTMSPEQRLELGMIAGAQQVRDGLREKYGKDKNTPPGLDSRLKALDTLPKMKAVVKLGRF